MKKLIGRPAAMRLASRPVPVPIPFCRPLVPVPAMLVMASRWRAMFWYIARLLYQDELR